MIVSFSYSKSVLQPQCFLCALCILCVERFYGVHVAQKIKSF